MKGYKQRVLTLEKFESKSHLSATLAHEIRYPMNTAKGFLQLIATSDFNDEKKREFAVIAISELDRADYIIKDFFTYSNSKPNSKEDIKLKDVIQETLIVLNPLANINSVQMFFYSNSDSLICGEVETWEGKPPGAAWRMYIIW